MQFGVEALVIYNTNSIDIVLKDADLFQVSNIYGTAPKKSVCIIYY